MFAGDAAHPMYPRGSNGAAQAAIDARTLADELAKGGPVTDALRRYEDMRRPATAAIVRTNRQHPPDFINIKVERLVGDQPLSILMITSASGSYESCRRITKILRALRRPKSETHWVWTRKLYGVCTGSFRAGSMATSIAVCRLFSIRPVSWKRG
jgi:2-polyprenyl-6-methoxyphenol hydroxylase-like FAD-dependent oxidoreductase